MHEEYTNIKIIFLDNSRLPVSYWIIESLELVIDSTRCFLAYLSDKHKKIFLLGIHKF